MGSVRAENSAYKRKPPKYIQFQIAPKECSDLWVVNWQDCGSICVFAAWPNWCVPPSSLRVSPELLQKTTSTRADLKSHTTEQRVSTTCSNCEHGKKYCLGVQSCPRLCRFDRIPPVLQSHVSSSWQFYQGQTVFYPPCCHYTLAVSSTTMSWFLPPLHFR